MDQFNVALMIHIVLLFLKYKSSAGVLIGLARSYTIIMDLVPRRTYNDPR